MYNPSSDFTPLLNCTIPIGTINTFINNKKHKFHIHQCQPQIEIWHFPDVHLKFTWPPDHHLTFPWPLPDTFHSMTFTWRSPDHLTIIWPSPVPYLTLISSFQLKKVVWWVVVVGQPITTPISGSSFDVIFHVWHWAWQWNELFFLWFSLFQIETLFFSKQTLMYDAWRADPIVLGSGLFLSQSGF